MILQVGKALECSLGELLTFVPKINFLSYIESIHHIPKSSFSYGVSFLRIPFGFYYLSREYYKEEHSLFGAIGNLLLIPADIGGGVVLFGEITIESLAKFALGIGIVALSVAVIYCAAYVAIGINSILILTDSRQSNFAKRQAAIDLANAIMQIALAAFFIVGYSYLPVLLTFGILGASFGILGFCHRYAQVLSETKKESEVSNGNS